MTVPFLFLPLLQAVNDLVKKLEQENITCRGAVTFGENDFEDQLQLLKVKTFQEKNFLSPKTCLLTLLKKFPQQDLDTRIIFGSFSKEVAPKIFCKVSKNKILN